MNIGIDIIKINHIPNYNSEADKRFFIDNFTTDEIKYALSSRNSSFEFARLFSIKESIIKCDNSYIKKNFNKIEILINDRQFHFRDFKISTSLNSKYCISMVLISKK